MEPNTKSTKLSTLWRILAIILLPITTVVLLPASPAFLEPIDHGGYALAFDGNNDYVQFDETSQVFGAGWADTKTVSLWVRPTASTTCGLDPALCDVIFSERPHWWGITIGQINAEDKIWIWNFDGDTDYVAVDYTLDEWVHITLVHDGGMLRAYRNGVEVGSTPSGTTARPTGGEDSILQMGAIIPDNTENWSFAGELDEVRLWNIARSTSDVQQDMYNSLNGDEPGLVAYYMMSDGPPSMTLTDDTGNGWDGTLHDGNAFAPADGSPPEWVTSTIPHDGSPTPTPTSTTTPGPTATNTPTPTPSGTPPTSTPTPTAQPTDAFIYLPLVNKH